MYVPLQLYHYDLFILMWSLFLRVQFLEVLFHIGDVERGSTHLPSMCVEPLSVSVCWRKSAEQVQDKLCTYYRSIYARQARGIWPMLVQCWPRRI